MLPKTLIAGSAFGFFTLSLCAPHELGPQQEMAPCLERRELSSRPGSIFSYLFARQNDAEDVQLQREQSEEETKEAEAKDSADTGFKLAIRQNDPGRAAVEDAIEAVKQAAATPAPVAGGGPATPSDPPMI
ncbi:hypothetical protein ACLMJK_007591 [Lecanora helva]